MSKIYNMNFWIENDPPPLHQFIRFGDANCLLGHSPKKQGFSFSFPREKMSMFSKPSLNFNFQKTCIKIKHHELPTRFGGVCPGLNRPLSNMKSCKMSEHLSQRATSKSFYFPNETALVSQC